MEQSELEVVFFLCLVALSIIAITLTLSFHQFTVKCAMRLIGYSTEEVMRHSLVQEFITDDFKTWRWWIGCRTVVMPGAVFGICQRVVSLIQ